MSTYLHVGSVSVERSHLPRSDSSSDLGFNMLWHHWSVYSLVLLLSLQKRILHRSTVVAECWLVT